MEDRRQSTSFKCKKWTLFSFCLVSIVGAIVVAAVASVLIDNYVDANYKTSGIFHYTRSEIEAIKSFSKTLVYIVCSLTILFQLLGLFGAYKEHYCMTMTYAILMTLGALGSISTSVRTPSLWWSTILNFAVCINAYLFLHDLRQIRLQLFASPIYVTNAGPSHTHIVHIPGPSGAYNGQYGQPQYGQPQYGQAQYGQQYDQQYGSQPTGTWQAPPPPYANEKGAPLP